MESERQSTHLPICPGCGAEMQPAFTGEKAYECPRCGMEAFSALRAPAEAPVHIYVNAKCAAIPMNGVYTLTHHDGDLRYTRETSSSREQAYKAVVEAARGMYSYQQSISSPDTRWGLPVYQKFRAALADLDALERNTSNE